jgi:hypothetical protein
MDVMSELGGDLTARGSDLREPVLRRSSVGFSLAMAACVIVVLAVALLLVVQPGKKSAPSQPGSLCFDSAMQMEMPCKPAP